MANTSILLDLAGRRPTLAPNTWRSQINLSGDQALEYTTHQPSSRTSQAPTSKTVPTLTIFNSPSTNTTNGMKGWPGRGVRQMYSTVYAQLSKASRWTLTPSPNLASVLKLEASTWQTMLRLVNAADSCIRSISSTERLYGITKTRYHPMSVSEKSLLVPTPNHMPEGCIGETLAIAKNSLAWLYTPP